MIEIINGIAYIKGIKDPTHSQIMFKYLKEHQEQKLYIIEGVNKYGCGQNGELTKFENMPSWLIENGFCINPFYSANKAVTVTESSDDNNIDKTSINEETSQGEPINDVKQCDECNEKKVALENIIEQQKNQLTEYEKEIEFLKNNIEQLVEKCNCLNEDVTELSQAVQFEKERADDSNTVGKSDIRELCKALYNLGFDVQLSYVEDKD